MRLWGIAFALALGCATPHPGIPESYHALLRAGDEAAKDGDLRRAREKYAAAISSRIFETLNTQSKHNLLSSAMSVNLQLLDEMRESLRDPKNPGGFTIGDFLEFPKEAFLYAKKATPLPEATLQDWYVRFAYAGFADEPADRIFSLTAIARLGGAQKLRQQEVLEQARQPSNSEEFFQMELALFRANWTLESGEQPGWLWMQLAVALLERGDL
ncbi:MAG TPA: hypothetical protein VGI70_17840, partial [Polyangiales bacterium]